MNLDPEKLRCAKCDYPLHDAQLNNGPQPCYYCGHQVNAVVFPAFYESLEKGGSGETRASDAEAGCFYHPQKRAERVCASCGRFICELCSVNLDDNDICARCLEISVENKEYVMFENQRVLYDSIALQLSVLPAVFILPTILTAPASAYLCVRYWKAPLSIIPRTKIRFILAFLISGAQITAWAYLIYEILRL